MEKPKLYLLKSKHLYPQKSKGISFFAFLLSIFLYISIFYIFNISPSHLLHNTKFWFLISNTLIFIISVDYSAFSSSKHDFYDEHVAMRRQSSDPLFVKRIPEPVKTDIPDDQVICWSDQSVTNKDEDFQQMRTGSANNERRRVTINVPKGDETESAHCESRQTVQKRDIDPDHPRENIKVAPAKTYMRSKSDVVKRVTFDESKNVVRRVEAVKYEPPDYVDEEEDDNESTNDQYANLSNEELNRRVEDFIQRFNQQIRQQKEVF